MLLPKELNDMHIPGLIHRLCLLQNELSSSTKLHCSKGRTVGWCLLTCPWHFMHRLAVSKVGLKVLQKSHLLSEATHCVVLVLFSHTPHSYPQAIRQQVTSTCRSEECPKPTLQYSVCRKGIKCHLRTTEYKLVSSVTSWRTSNIW